MKTLNINDPIRGALKHVSLAVAVVAGLGGTRVHAAPPVNDNFAAAILLPGDSGSVSGHTNADATLEPGEPVCVYEETTNTVWFKWECAQAGSFTLSTAGSTTAGATEWDALVCVYQGASVDALTLLKSQDSGFEEVVELAVSPGTYYFQLGGFAPPSPGDVATDLMLTWSYSPLSMVDLSGDLPQVLDAVVGAGNTGRLIANAKSYWAGTNSSSDVILNDFEFTIDTGGGNAQTYNGAFTGPGNLRFRGRGDATWEPDMRLGGTAPNSPSGVTINQGRVQLNKTPGVDALAGPITVNTSQTVRIQLLASNQINDASTITSTAGGGMFHLDLGGFSETIERLEMKTGDRVNTGIDGVLKVTSLKVGDEELPKGAYTVNSGFVTGSGYIDVDDFGPPVIDDPPGVPGSPAPADADNTVNPAFFTKLTWSPASDATSYDVYLWLAAETKPGTPTANVVLPEFTVSPQLLSLSDYKWQVVAKNSVGNTDGPEWTFTTMDRRDISGNLPQTLDAIVGAGPARLIANAMTYWQGTTSLTDINLNGFQFTIDTGGGNTQIYNGAITGLGTLRLRGRGDASWEPDMRLGGTVANSPENVLIIRGRVQLNKTPGVDALAGPITVNTSETVRIQLLASDQINNASTIDSTSGSGAFHLMMGSFSDTIASLAINAGHTVDTTGGGVLTVASLIVDGATLTGGPYTADNSTFVTGDGSVVVAGASDNYATWATGKGLVGGDADFDADPDGDGIKNGLEFVLGGEPNPANAGANSVGLLPTGEVIGTDFVFTFALMNEAAYLNPVVEFDADLQGVWTTAINGVNSTILVTPGSPSATVTVTIPKGANTEMFARLKVMEP